MNVVYNMLGSRMPRERHNIVLTQYVKRQLGDTACLRVAVVRHPAHLEVELALLTKCTTVRAVDVTVSGEEEKFISKT